MATVTFDTHEFIQTLKTANFTEPQAEAIARAYRVAHEAQELVTKEYLDYRLRVDIAELKTDLIKWMTGALIAQAAVIAALVKLL